MLLFSGCAALYIVVAAVLVLHYGSIVGDAESRVANGWYILFSRDPHLAAIGFVWNPLPSVLELPFIALKGVFPALTERAFAGNLVSAVCAAACVVQFRGALQELKVRGAVVWTLTAFLALNPMFLYYAANGMSEAPYLLFLVMGVRYLTRWMSTRATSALVVSGCAFGLGYLTRYEMAASAVAAMGIVAGVVFARTKRARRVRVRAAAAETFVFSLPFLTAFFGWALISYVIKGEAFIQLDANQGNALLIRQAGGIHATSLNDSLPIFAAKQFLAFGPLLPILIALAVVVAWSRREWLLLGAVPLLAALAFTYVAFVQGQLFPWLRYYLPALPLSLLLVGYLVPRAVPAAGDRRSRWESTSKALVSVLAVSLVAALGTYTVVVAMWDRYLGSIERGSLTWIVHGEARTKSEREERHRVQAAQNIAADLDRRDLGSGQLVVDTNTACVSMVLMNLRHPHLMVVPSDRDWQRILEDPPIFGVHYLLIPPPVGNSALDNVGIAYPGTYENGGALAKLVKEYDEVGCPKFRLYRLRHSPTVGHGGAIVNG